MDQKLSKKNWNSMSSSLIRIWHAIWSPTRLNDFFSKIEFQDFSRLFFKAHLALMRIWLLLLLCCVALSDIRFLAQQDFCAPNLINNFLILSLSLLLCLKILKIVSFYTPSTHFNVRRILIKIFLYVFCGLNFHPLWILDFN